MNKEERQKLIQDLEEEMKNIEQELNRIAVKNEQVPGDYKAKFPDDVGPGDDVGERASAESDWERNRAVEQELEIKLKDIKETLTKLKTEDSSYGICKNCTSPIAEARLKAMPISNLCVDCAKKASLV